MSENKEKQRLLRIVLTRAAERKIKEAKSTSLEVIQNLEELDSIKLFYHKTQKNKEEDDYGKIALPFCGGQRTLLLTPDEKGGKYFVAVDFWSDRIVDIDSPDHYSPPSDVRCQLDDSKDDGISCDHEQIFDEVIKLKIWRPFQSSGIEEKKWEKYFELCEKTLAKKFDAFVISDIGGNGQHIEAQLEGGNSIRGGKDLIFSKGMSKIVPQNTKDCKRLGKVKSITKTTINIDLDKEFKEFLKNFRCEVQGHVIADICRCHGDEVRFLSAEKFKELNNNDCQEEDFNYAKGLAFRAEACKRGMQVYVNKDKIWPLKLHCAPDLGSDRYQLGVMKDCFYEVKKKPIWDVLSGKRVTDMPDAECCVQFHNSRLNERQKEAVKGALGTREQGVFLIWGPPGTGKTEVITEITRHESAAGKKTLIASQTNLAVDNALARLYGVGSACPIRLARLGYELEGEDMQKVPFQDSTPRFYLERLQRQIEEKLNGRHEKELQQQRSNFLNDVKRAIKKIKKENKKSEVELREFKQFAKLYKEKINVVGATLMECGRREYSYKDGKRKDGKRSVLSYANANEFDTVIIDEVSKATPPDLFIPIVSGKRIILVGDHKQLPPMLTILSDDNGSGDVRLIEELAEEVKIDPKELDPDNTIFERLWQRHEEGCPSATAKLTRQYRMHKKIQGLIEQFYKDIGSEGTLICGLTDEELKELEIRDHFFKPVIWIGTRQRSIEEKEGTSFYNRDEIKKVGKLLDRLAKIGDKNMSVGVITFYGAQLARLRREYDKRKSDFGKGKLIFGTVDRFQGRECDVVICSLVRNNENKRGNIGFTSKPNRINVAFSRARKALIILGSKQQFVDRVKDEHAKNIYGSIYGKCYHPEPEEL